MISKFATTQNVSWSHIKPNDSNDWINQRDEAFETFTPVGDKDAKGSQDVKAIFVTYSLG